MKLTFKEKIKEQEDVVRFEFTAPDSISWQPGQYIHYTFPHSDADDRGIERWFTISSAPFEKDIWISTRISKDRSSTFKQKLLGLKPGDTIETDAPEGDFTITDLTKNYVFVAGGIGITPFRSILKQLHHERKAIRAELLYANRDTSTIPYKNELEAISREQNGLNITYFIGENRIDAEALKAAGAKLHDPIYYVSGPEPMVEAFKTILESIGVDEEHSRFDYFPGYEAQ